MRGTRTYVYRHTEDSATLALLTPSIASTTWAREWTAAGGAQFYAEAFLATNPN